MMVGREELFLDVSHALLIEDHLEGIRRSREVGNTIVPPAIHVQAALERGHSRLKLA